MESNDLNKLTVEDLHGKLDESRKELFELRQRLFTKQASDTSAVRRVRRNIARILTVINQKKAAGSNSASA